jgi:hypothetical protein
MRTDRSATAFFMSPPRAREFLLGGIPAVLLGPAVQFRSRLPSMLMRADLRHAEARSDDFVLPDIFDLDQKMKAALPAHEGFSYVSVVDAVCPERQCPLTIDGGVPLAWASHRGGIGLCDGKTRPDARGEEVNRHSGAMRSIEPGISRFRVRPAGAPK